MWKNRRLAFIKNINIVVERVCGTVARGRYSKLTDADTTFFERILGNNCVKTKEIDAYNTDWMGWFKGSSKCVLFPKNREQVSSIIQRCFSNHLAVVPQSGNTGLVGGSVPVHDEIIISLSKLTEDFHFDPQSGVLECGAGFILEEINNRLAPYNYMMPYDLGAKGSCLIGGNVSSAAGGIRFLRYGSIHNHILGLTAVTADKNGLIRKFGSKMKKDNTGLHTHHLFVGAEGQLGIITDVIMNTVTKPKNVQVAMLGTNSYENCCNILQNARNTLGEILSAFEFMDSECMKCLEENKSLKNIIKSNPSFNILIETSGSNELHDNEKLGKFVNEMLDVGFACDGAQAMNLNEAKFMWKLRETITEALMHDGFVYKHDISLAPEYFYAITDVMKERMKDMVKRIVSFGHMGDGNLHFNVTAKENNIEIYNRLYPFIYDWVASKGGSFSAEHGVGRLKRPYLNLSQRNDHGLSLELKNVFDPRRILSPYKML